MTFSLLDRVLLVAAVLLSAGLALWLVRRTREAIRSWFRRAVLRSLHRFQVRLDRYKLVNREVIRDALLRDPEIQSAIREHGAAQGMPGDDVRRRVERYIDEIVPFFNVLSYYKLGYNLSRILINLLYRVSITYADRPRLDAIPRQDVVLYLMNHRSNADYVVVAYVLARGVSISYAVGEWARTWPLEYIFKSFGSYFIRRRYREPLYHTVLERYVQLITRNGVTQGIFPEGGLTRDGRLRPPKIGLLDYILGVAREPGFAERMYVVPVALNYDRVLEDRSLMRELRAKEGGESTSRVQQFREVLNYAVSNFGRLSTRRWRRYGRAAVVVGEPVPVAPWLDGIAASGTSLFDHPRAERLALVQDFCETQMHRIGEIIPVTAVPLTCAALQTFDAEFIPRARLFERIAQLRDVLVAEGAEVVEPAREAEETFERAHRMLRMRRVLAEESDGFVILPRGREIISYYANGIAHLCGSFEDAVRARDALPADHFIGA